MTEIIRFGLDLGMGALKLHGNQQSIQLISQVAVNNGPLVGRMLGLAVPACRCGSLCRREARSLSIAVHMTADGLSRT